MRFIPHKYQQAAIDFILERFRSHQGAAAFLEPGLGKTAIALDVIRQLKPRKTLIVAPLRVIYSVWPAEVEKWGYNFRTAIIHGTPKKKLQAIDSGADIYLINPEGLLWLEKNGRLPKMDLLIVDESTKFKNWTAKRTKILRRLIPVIPKRLILTGTPSPNSLADLFSQIYIVDQGDTLGRTVGAFRRQYMRSGGFEGRQWFVRPDMVEPLQEAVKPCSIHMDAISHLDMPDLLYHRVPVTLPPRVADEYRALEKKLIFELENESTLVANSAVAKYLLCRQVANGGAYQVDPITRERTAIGVHRAKVDALADLVDELGGKQVLVAYQFNHDLERIRQWQNVEAINGRTKPGEMADILKRWRAREVGTLAVQCQALSHGVDGFQDGGNDVVWFGLTDQAEIHTQLNCRLYRQGVEGQVRIHYLVAADTVDEAIIETISRKDAGQAKLLDALRRRGIDAN